MAYVNGNGVELRKNVSKMLYHVGERGLRASPIFYEEGTRLGQNLFRTLQRDAKTFTVAGPHFNGSFGKKTDVIQPDLDLVVVLNNYTPPVDLPQVINEMHDILLLNLDELQIVEESIDCRKRLIQFCFKNGIKVDLVPAPNLSEGEALELMARNPDEFQTFNVCVGTKQVDFIKSHPANFRHALIRLLKLWYKSLIGLGKISGGSSLMEVVAIAAAEMEQDFDQPDMFRAFIRAIEWFAKLDSVKIAFEEIGFHQWKRIPSHQLGLSHVRNLVPKVIGTVDILKQQSFIVDPANPYCDFSPPRGSEQREKLIQYAKETKKRFDALLSGDTNYIKFNGSTNVVDVNFLRLFRAQPSESIPGSFPICVPRDFTIGYQYPASSATNSMIVRNEQAFRREGVKNYIAGLKRNLLCAVQFSLHGKGSSKPGAIPDIRKTVDKFVEESLNVKLIDGGIHDDKDVSLMIPYELDGNRYALKMSLSF